MWENISADAVGEPLRPLYPFRAPHDDAYPWSFDITGWRKQFLALTKEGNFSAFQRILQMEVEYEFEWNRYIYAILFLLFSVISK